MTSSNKLINDITPNFYQRRVSAKIAKNFVHVTFIVVRFICLEDIIPANPHRTLNSRNLQKATESHEFAQEEAAEKRITPL